MFIHNIDIEISQSILEQIFKISFPNFIYVRLPKDKNYAFAEFKNNHDCKKALKNLNGVKIGKSMIKAKYQSQRKQENYEERKHQKEDRKNDNIQKLNDIKLSREAFG